MESKVEEYVLVPKRDGNLIGLPSSSKPSDCQSSVQSDSTSSKDSSTTATVVDVGAKKQQAKPRQCSKRRAEQKTKAPKNGTINKSCNEQKTKHPQKDAINKSTETSDLILNETREETDIPPKKIRSVARPSLKEKCARLEEEWVKL